MGRGGRGGKIQIDKEHFSFSKQCSLSSLSKRQRQPLVQSGGGEGENSNRQREYLFKWGSALPARFQRDNENLSLRVARKLGKSEIGKENFPFTGAVLVELVVNETTRTSR